MPIGSAAIAVERMQAKDSDVMMLAFFFVALHFQLSVSADKAVHQIYEALR